MSRDRVHAALTAHVCDCAPLRTPLRLDAAAQRRQPELPAPVSRASERNAAGPAASARANGCDGARCAASVVAAPKVQRPCASPPPPLARRRRGSPLALVPRAGGPKTFSRAARRTHTSAMRPQAGGNDAAASVRAGRRAPARHQHRTREVLRSAEWAAQRPATPPDGRWSHWSGPLLCQPRGLPISSAARASTFRPTSSSRAMQTWAKREVPNSTGEAPPVRLRSVRGLREAIYVGLSPRGRRPQEAPMASCRGTMPAVTRSRTLQASVSRTQLSIQRRSSRIAKRRAPLAPASTSRHTSRHGPSRARPLPTDPRREARSDRGALG